jgi:RNA polymerase sigma factor (sigma-70 family)
MHQPSDQHRSDWVLVQKYLAGDSRILEDWVSTLGPILRRKLIERGATTAEAEELVANLWSDCVSGGTKPSSLMEKYTGRAPLQSWLLTVATRRLIDFKRKQRFTTPPDPPSAGQSSGYRLMEGTAAEPEIYHDDSLLELLGRCLRKAWGRCAADDLLMLRLVHLHGLTQREVGQMWGWQESKVSRCLSQTMRQIEQETLRQLRQSDPWLQLTWQDFLDLCETGPSSFL